MGEKDYMTQLGTDIDLTTSGVGGNILDFGVANPNKGKGTPLEAEITIKTAAAGTSVVFKLQDCDTEGGTYADIATTKTYAASELTAGKIIKIPLPDEHRRYVQLAHVSTSITAGTADAYLQP